MIDLIIHGVAGRMGSTIAEMALQKPDVFRIAAGIDKFAQKVADAPFPVYTTFDDCAEACDCIIDFSLPEALPGVIEAACAKKSALVIATTGMRASDLERIKAASAIIPIFMASNMSLGVNLQIDLIKRAATFFGDAFDIEIVEKHHNIKVDAPSGTAMTLAREIASTFPDGKDFVFNRHDSRQRRDKREIGIHAVRGGTIVGEHDVSFFGEDECLTIEHKAYSKRVFGAGALRAAAFVSGLPAKLYSMSEMLAEEKAITNANLESDQSIITLHKVPFGQNALASLFETVAACGVNVDMISQSIPKDGFVDIAFTLPGAAMKDAVAALSAFPYVYEQRDAMAKLCIEGAGMEHRPGVAASVFRVLADAGIALELVTTSETKIAICLSQDDSEKALAATNAAFSLN